MKQKSRINGMEYTFLESLPVLGEKSTLILCADSCGNRVLCPEELWRSGEVCENEVFSINTHSSSQQKIELFLSLFKGRENVYARRYSSVKTGKSGYTPVCKNEWQHGLCDKKKYRCPDCPNREFLPLTSETAKTHLMGRDPLCRDVIAIYTVNRPEAEESNRAEDAAAVELLREARVDVVLHDDLAQRYAVIDESIVWYGSVDLLAFGRKDADVLRFENADIAGDLLALNDGSMCEQLIIQDA